MPETVQLTPTQWLVLALVTFMAGSAALHALLHKRDPCTAFGWIAVCLLFPAVGPLLYVLFGVNRIRTRARRLQSEHAFHAGLGEVAREVQARFAPPRAELPRDFAAIARVSDAVTRRPLLAGNRVEPLHDGEQAYPAMRQAIAEARHSVLLSSYIFQADQTGHAFASALDAARRRGVDVRVVVDGLGEYYGLPGRIGADLADSGVRVARFLPPRLLPPSLHINLRNHRKILVVDGRVGFTGGMNISDRHLHASPPPPARIRDLHFQLEGPVVSQLEHAFLEDWRFCTGREEAPPESHDWRHGAAPGEALCRVIAQGPNESRNKLSAILTAAITLAAERVTIVTPYFLPSREMIGALQTAALGGVEVTLLLPGRNNLPFVHWATRNVLRELLEFGVRAFYQPPPFTHTKLFLVDGFYAQMGSANIDPRSLRLNFELNVEVFDRALIGALSAHADRLRAASRPISAAEIEARPMLAHARDAAAWLFMPYL